MNTTIAPPANFTRRTRDLAGRLRREGRYGFLGLVHVLRLSDLGREGIERSGSYRFADHVYANRASGRGILGRAIDRLEGRFRKRAPDKLGIDVDTALHKLNQLRLRTVGSPDVDERKDVGRQLEAWEQTYLRR